MKFRQKNKNNNQYHYWGDIEGKLINPQIQDNYKRPGKSEMFSGRVDSHGVEIYVGSKLQLRTKYTFKKDIMKMMKKKLLLQF